MGLVKAIHLKRPNDPTAARSWLPGLVRKLIWATVPAGSKVNVPAFEQVGRPGFDGTVEAKIKDQYVPNGRTVWEIGTDDDKVSKANKDYNKRTKATKAADRRRMTYVCVSSQEWQKKDEWVKERKAEKKWKNVLALDCNDLEQWMERHPHVDLWLAELLQLPCRGLVDLNRRWDELSSVGKHTLSTDVFLVGREKVMIAIQEFLNAEPSAVLLKCASVQDGSDFLTAVHASADEDSSLQRMIVVNDHSIWQEISASPSPTCLVVPSHVELSPEEVSRAIQSGHHVLIVGQRSGSLDDQMILLERQNVDEIGSALSNCGYSEPEAKSIGFASAGSTAVLKRLIARHPATLLPEWAKDRASCELAPYALIGAWNRAEPPRPEVARYFGPGPADMALLEDFLERDRETIEGDIARWSSCDDPLMMAFGNSVLVSSRELAWHLLAPQLTKAIRERFIAFATLILGDEDASLGLPPEQRWAAALYGKSNACSNELREGVIQTLALMAAIVVKDANGNPISFEADIREVIDHVLPDDAGWRKWATLDGFLPMLCEAAPDLILAKVEKDLRRDDSGIAKCFAESGTGMMERRYHCGLLWALEILAWNEQHFPRVAAVLLRLANLEHRLPHNLGNRPTATFSALFNHWIPGTTTDANRKVEVLRQLVDSDLEAGWRLVAMLVREIQSPPGTTETPRWRTWADKFDQAVVDLDRPGYVQAVSDLAHEIAGNDPERWIEIIRSMLLRISRQTTDRTIGHLNAMVNTVSASIAKSDLWLELVDIVEQQERLDPEKHHRLDDTRLNRLRDVCDRMRPNDPVYQHAWLFDDPRTVSGYEVTEDFDAYNKELNRLQRDAVREIHLHGGDGAVFRLANRPRWTYPVAFPSGVENLLSVDTILDRFADKKNNGHEFATFYARGRFAEAGESMLADWGVAGLEAEQAMDVLLALQSDPTIWRWIDDNMSPEAIADYWKRVPSHCFLESLDDLQFAVARFVSHDRPLAACKLLQLKHEKIEISVDLIARCLEAALNANIAPLPQDIDAYCIQKLVGLLQEANFNAERLAWIEWGYIEILTAHHSRTPPLTLATEAKRSPEFFRALVAASYAKSLDPDKDPTVFQMVESKRTQARKLLHSLQEVPGEADDEIDQSALSQWIHELRSVVVEDDELEQIGMTLGNWLGRRCLADESGRIIESESVFQALEELCCDATMDGFEEAVSHGRGVTSRSPFEGGNQERELEDYFNGLSVKHSTKFPLVATCFRKLANHYRSYAEHEDEEAAQTRLHRR